MHGGVGQCGLRVAYAQSTRQEPRQPTAMGAHVQHPRGAQAVREAGLSRARGAGWRGWAAGWTSGGAGAGRASGARPAFSAAAVGGAGKLLGGTGQ